MSERSTVIVHERAMAFAGMFFFGSTCPIHRENGRPLSRANAKVWRAVKAFQEMVATVMRIMMMLVSPLTPAVLTAWRKT